MTTPPSAPLSPSVPFSFELPLVDGSVVKLEAPRTISAAGWEHFMHILGTLEPGLVRPVEGTGKRAEEPARG